MKYPTPLGYKMTPLEKRAYRAGCAARKHKHALESCRSKRQDYLLAWAAGWFDTDKAIDRAIPKPPASPADFDEGGPMGEPYYQE